MNLYKIKVKHHAPKGHYRGILKYVVAQNESEVYDEILDVTCYDTRSIDSIICTIPNYDSIGKSDREIRKDWKNYVISTKGEMDSDWADYDDLLYGVAHYGWELHMENITEEQIKVLRLLNIL